MATINVATSQNLTAVTYAAKDIINVLDGVTLTANSQWAVKPYLIQALGTGRIVVSNASTTTLHVQEFDMQNGLNSGGFSTTQNGGLEVLGDWIIVGTSTGTNNETLFSANNIGGKAIDYPTEIEVETGSGTNVWEVWQAVPLDVPGGLVNTLGFNAANAVAGTVAVSAAGVVTGTGTAFTSAMPGIQFKLPSIARDFVIGAFTSATSITIQELDGSTYTGGVISAGSSYIIRSGSLISPSVVGSGDIGKVLFFNPVTTAVTHGDGTNGTKVPTGARVRVPNIHFNSALQQTTLAAAITSTAAQAITLAAAIGTTTNDASATAPVGTLLLVNGSTIERISYTTRSGTTVSATGMFRGVAGTTAQASFPIGTLVYWIPAANNIRNNAVFNTNVSGTVDLQICSAGLRMQATFNNYASATIKHFGCALFAITNSSGAYDLDTISSIGQYQFPGGGVGATVSSLIGSGSIASIHAHGNFALASGGTGISSVNIQDAQAISNLRCRMFGRTSSVSVNYRSILLQTVTCATTIDGLYFNMVFQAITLTNQDIKNIYFAATTSSASASTADSAFPVYAQSCVNNTFRGFQLWSGGLATRNLINLDTNSAGNVFHNKGYPAIDGGGQLGAITSDTGLNTITAFFSVTNPRVSTTSASYLRQDTATNSGGLLRMLLIDSITATSNGTGGAAKGGVEIDMIAGPHRLYNTNAAISVVPNLVDVQPIVVLSNTAKTVGSVYVGPFSAQNSFDMYEFTGGAYLDNLGRIYYPNAGDSFIIKSVFALKGFSAFTGTAFDFNYNLGAGTNPIPAGTTVEFRLTHWGTPITGAWAPITDNASLETARAALSGFSSSVGVDLQLRITGTTAVAGRYIIGLKFPVTIDAAYNPPVDYTDVGFSGAQTGTLIAGYLNASPSTPLLQGSATLSGTSGSVPMPYDYDATPVPYRLVARKPGWTFSDLTGTYTKTDISIPITQFQVVDTSGVPIYVSGITGVSVDAITISVSASRSAVQIWSAVQDYLCLLANLTKADPFTTSNGLSFVSNYTLIVSGTLTAGNIIGNVTLLSTGVLSSGIVITGNVTQNRPINFTGVTINGNLTFNTSLDTTVTFTDCNVTGSISNSGLGIVKIVKAGSTPWLTTGARVSNIANVVVETPGGLALSTYIVKNGATDLGWVTGNIGRLLEITQTDTFQIYAIAYGYKAKLVSANALDLTSFKFELLPEAFIDTSLSPTTRNLIATKFSTALDAYNRIALSLDTDLRYYTPDEVMNAVQYYIVTQGSLIAASVLYGGTIDGVEIIQGGILISTPGFYGKVADSVTTTNDLGILVPIFIDVLPAVYTADPTYSAVRKNSSGLILQSAPWTKMTADISSLDKTDIRQGLATEDNVTAVRFKTDAYLDVTVSSRLSTAAYSPSGGSGGTAPTAAQNAAAVRTELTTELARIDVATSSRLATSGYTAPDNTSVAAIKAKTDANLDAAVSTRLAASAYTAPTSAPTSTDVAAAVRTELATELARLDAAVTSRLAAASYTAPGTAPTSAQNAAAVRTELAAELARIDAAVSSRLAASGYTAPGPVPTSAQNAAAVRTELATELARLDAAVSTRLAASAYTASGTAPTSAEVAAAVRAELAAELARMDAAVSTRLAASGYTAPDNAGITAIKGNAALIPALL